MEMATLTIKFDGDTYDRLSAYAYAHNVSKSAVIRKVLTEAIEECRSRGEKIQVPREYSRLNHPTWRAMSIDRSLYDEFIKECSLSRRESFVVLNYLLNRLFLSEEVKTSRYESSVLRRNVVLTVKLDVETMRKLNAICLYERKSRSELVRELIINKIKEYENKLGDDDVKVEIVT